MDYALYKKMKDDIEREHQKKLDALELLWENYRPRNPNGEKKSSRSGEPGKISDAMRTVISGFNSEFTPNDVQEGLKDVLGDGNFTRLQITNTLHRFYRRGEIEVVQKGRGRASGTYRRKLTVKAQVA